MAKTCTMWAIRSSGKGAVLRQADTSASNDPWADAIDRVVQTANAASRAIRESAQVVDVLRHERARGVSLAEIVREAIESGGREKRLAASAAIRAYEHAMMEFRASVVRDLVDSEGLSLSEVARRMKISRQMATRLYRAAT
jgi:hypothetical protein